MGGVGFEELERLLYPKTHYELTLHLWVPKVMRPRRLTRPLGSLLGRTA